MDLISREAALDALCDDCPLVEAVCSHYPCREYLNIEGLSSAQPTIYGYNIEHLELIARVLQKEDLPPERVVEILTDISRIVTIVADEFEDSLRKGVNKWT